MILGKITGKLTTTNFNFLVEGDARKFQYCQVYHKDYDYVLCQITELEKDSEKTLARCNVIGYNDGRIKQPRTPLEPGTEVLLAEDDLIKQVINLPTEESAFIGNLEGKNISIHLDLNILLTKHVSILAKSGSGKSYTTGVLIEEIIEKKVPLLIIDPHGEYSELKTPSEDKEELSKFGLHPTSYEIQEYGDPSLDLKPILLTSILNPEELIHILPTKLSPSHQSFLYSIITEDTNFDHLMLQIQSSDNPARFSLLALMGSLQKQNIFSEDFTPFNELIQPGKASIINLKGIDPDIQQIIVYKLLTDLFQHRKANTIPPFFCVVEEAHNFAPERGFGEAKSSKILRTIASEGRKFGLGLCIVSQRPARIDKNVLSQCSTQMILRITNPNDLKAITSSVEGLTTEAEKEITNLPVGTAMITGIVDLPLFVTIRPRKTKHGGDSPQILDVNVLEDTKKFEDKHILPIIPSKVSILDLELSAAKEISKITTFLIPAIQIKCIQEDQEFTLLAEQLRGEILTNISKSESVKLPHVENFSANELNVIKTALSLSEFTEENLINQSPISNELTRSIFTSLLKKDIFNFNNGTYTVTRSFNVLFNPETLATYEKIEYKEVLYDKKMDIKVSLEEIKNNLSNFVNIISVKECWVVYHHVVYK